MPPLIGKNPDQSNRPGRRTCKSALQMGNTSRSWKNFLHTFSKVTTSLICNLQPIIHGCCVGSSHQTWCQGFSHPHRWKVFKLAWIILKTGNVRRCPLSFYFLLDIDQAEGLDWTGVSRIHVFQNQRFPKQTCQTDWKVVSIITSMRAALQQSSNVIYDQTGWDARSLEWCTFSSLEWCTFRH